MMLVGLSGLAGSGKDTVGDILRDEHDFIITSFAWPIKKMICEALIGVPIEKWNDREWRERELPVVGKSPRYLAQTLGTEWGREIIKDSLWLDLALSRIESEDLWDLVAITDLRFENEATQIRESGGIVVHVVRDQRDVCHAGHASEKGIKRHYSDYVIFNNDTMEELHKQVKSFVRAQLQSGGPK